MTSLRAFAGEALPPPAELAARRWHAGRPEVLAAPLRLKGDKANEAAATLGLHTIGDLLEHLPRDRREARTVGELAPGEQATVAVAVGPTVGGTALRGVDVAVGNGGSARVAVGVAGCRPR